MSRLRWPDSTNSVSDVPGTIQPRPTRPLVRNLDDGAMKKILVGAAAFGCSKGSFGASTTEIPVRIRLFDEVSFAGRTSIREALFNAPWRSRSRSSTKALRSTRWPAAGKLPASSITPRSSCLTMECSCASNTAPRGAVRGALRSPPTNSRPSMLGRRKPRVVIGLICGSDGIAAFSYDAYRTIASPGTSAVHIGCRRDHRKYYVVSGPCGVLDERIAQSDWRQLLHR